MCATNMRRSRPSPQSANFGPYPAPIPPPQSDAHHTLIVHKRSKTSFAFFLILIPTWRGGVRVVPEYSHSGRIATPRNTDFLPFREPPPTKNKCGNYFRISLKTILGRRGNKQQPGPAAASFVSNEVKTAIAAT